MGLAGRAANNCTLAHQHGKHFSYKLKYYLVVVSVWCLGLLRVYRELRRPTLARLFAGYNSNGAIAACLRSGRNHLVQTSLRTKYKTAESYDSAFYLMAVVICSCIFDYQSAQCLD